MGLFDVIGDVVSMPIRIGVDIVKIPKDVVDGGDIFSNTSKGIKKIERDLED